MGAWSFVCSRFGKELRNQSGEITYIGRPYAASPAVGYLSVHKKEQEALVRRALQI
jgi:2-oxoglutarate dehydrogenase E1 component